MCTENMLCTFEGARNKKAVLERMSQSRLDHQKM